MNEVEPRVDFEQRGSRSVAEATELAITNPDRFVMAGGFVSGMKRLQKEIEGAFAEAVASTDKAHTDVLRARDRYLDPVECAIEIIKGKLAAFHKENYDKPDELLESGKIVADGGCPKVPGISFRKTWKARIVDETKIPRVYLAPDTSKLDKFAKAMMENAKVPGVEFYRTTTVAVSDLD